MLRECCLVEMAPSGKTGRRRLRLCILVWWCLLVSFSPVCCVLATRTDGRGDVTSSSSSRPRRFSVVDPNSGVCAKDCSELAPNPLCGSDSRTYANKCALHQARLCGDAVDTDLTVTHRGECSTDYDCLEERARNKKAGEESGIPILVPVCKEDGSYADVQCHYGTGYCWCVNTATGTPIPGSTVRYDRPKCDHDRRRRKGRGKRRGSRRRNKKKNKRNKKGKGGGRKGEEGDDEKKKRRRRRKKGCTQSDRSEFNNHVLESVTREFKKHQRKRQLAAAGQQLGGVIGNRNAEAVEWKFDELDSDGDGALRKREFKQFRLAVKEVARKKVCARDFWRYCDTDSDKRIDREEWSSCLGMTENISLKLFLSLNEKATSERERGRGDPSSLLLPVRQRTTTTTTTTTTPAPSLNCWSEHERGLASSTPGAYVPECTPGGLFTPVQCYPSSGYCWCVDEVSGRPVDGTSVLNDKPDCGPPVGGGVGPLVGRGGSSGGDTGWKKCPTERRDKFRRALMDLMTDEMVTQAARASTRQAEEREADLTLEERVSAWKFRQMDSDGDGSVSRRELRPLRAVLMDDEEMRLCGKRIQVHCDPDGDGVVDRREWLVCMGVVEEDQADREAAVAGARRVHQPIRTRPVHGRVIDPGKRVGPNPLLTYLKAD